MGINSTEVSYGFGQMGSVFNDTANPCKAPTGKVYLDGNISVSEDFYALKERKKLANSGFLEVTIILDRNGKIIKKPVISFTVQDKWTDLLQLVLITVIGAYFGGRSLEKVKK